MRALRKRPHQRPAGKPFRCLEPGGAALSAPYPIGMGSSARANTRGLGRVPDSQTVTLEPHQSTNPQPWLDGAPLRGGYRGTQRLRAVIADHPQHDFRHHQLNLRRGWNLPPAGAEQTL